MTKEATENRSEWARMMNEKEEWSELNVER